MDDSKSKALAAASSIFMIEPLPNCFSIWESAAANALDLLSSISVVLANISFLSASTAAQAGPTPDTV
jgi:hypothetical protein